MREYPVPFCESLGVRFPGATRHKQHYTRDVTLHEDASHPPQPGRLRQTTQLRLQYPAVQPIRHHRPGSLRRRARRPQIPKRYELL